MQHSIAQNTGLYPSLPLPANAPEEIPWVKLHRMQMRKNGVSMESLRLTLRKNIYNAKHVILLVGIAGGEGTFSKTSAGNILQIEVCFLLGDCFIASLDYP